MFARLPYTTALNSSFDCRSSKNNAYKVRLNLALQVEQGILPYSGEVENTFSVFKILYECSICLAIVFKRYVCRQNEVHSSM